MGQGVLDLGALEELDVFDGQVGILRRWRCCERSRALKLVRTRTAQSDQRRFSDWRSILERRGDPGGLVLGRGAGLEDDGRALRGGVGQDLFSHSSLQSADDAGAGAQDGARGTVILIELDFAHRRELAAVGGQDFGGRGAAPFVDGLVDVAEEGEAAVGTGQGGEDAILAGIGVLDLVDLDPGEALLPAAQGGLVGLEQTVDADDEVGVVEGVVLAQGVDESGVELGEAEGGNVEAGRRVAGADVGEVVLGVAVGDGWRRARAGAPAGAREKECEALGRSVVRPMREAMAKARELLFLVEDEEVGVEAEGEMLAARRMSAERQWKVREVMPRSASAVRTSMAAGAHPGGRPYW